VFLPAGDAALSRRARQASRLSAVVVRFSRTRKRYERQGLLVEEAALESAEAQCLADDEARRRRRERDRERRAEQDVAFQARLAEAIVRLLSGCPAERAEAIARHAGARGSGRVGRSVAGRALDEQAVTLTVVEWAKACRLVRVTGGRLVPVQRNASLLDRPLELWAWMFETFPPLGAALCPPG
jgi:hypothetical protein